MFNESVVIDSMSSLMKIITLIGGFLVLVISSTYLKTFKIYNIEYPSSYFEFNSWNDGNDQFK